MRRGLKLRAWRTATRVHNPSMDVAMRQFRQLMQLPKPCTARPWRLQATRLMLPSTRTGAPRLLQTAMPLKLNSIGSAMHSVRCTKQYQTTDAPLAPPDARAGHHAGTWLDGGLAHSVLSKLTSIMCMHTPRADLTVLHIDFGPNS